MTHHIRNYRMHEEFRFGHHNHHRPRHGNFYQNSIFGGGCGCQGGYSPYGQQGYYGPQEPRKSFIDRVFPYALTGFLGYQVGKAPGNNLGEKVGGFLGGVGKFLGGIFGGSSSGGSSGGGLLGGIIKGIGSLFGGK